MKYKLNPLEITSEEFYHDTNSVYVRVTYVPEQRGFKIAVFNEIDISAVNEDMRLMATLCRGLAEVALNNPSDMVQIGREAQAQDMADMKANLSPEQQELMDSEPEGRA